MGTSQPAPDSLMSQRHQAPVPARLGWSAVRVACAGGAVLRRVRSPRRRRVCRPPKSPLTSGLASRRMRRSAHGSEKNGTAGGTGTEQEEAVSREGKGGAGRGKQGRGAQAREGATQETGGRGTSQGERERKQQKATGRRGQSAQAAPKPPGKTENKKRPRSSQDVGGSPGPA